MSLELEQIENVLASVEADCQKGARAFHYTRLTALLNKAKTRSESLRERLMPELDKGLSLLNTLLASDEPGQDLPVQKEPAPSAFKELIDHINSFDVKEIEKSSLGLDALLFELDETEITPSQNNEVKSEQPEKGFRKRAKELKSLQLYREQLGKVITENMVRQVIKEDPENAGPLNPQRLLVRTIGAMKDLSPAYVNRLVPYYDTLLWLEQAGEGKLKR